MSWSVERRLSSCGSKVKEVSLKKRKILGKSMSRRFRLGGLPKENEITSKEVILAF